MRSKNIRSLGRPRAFNDKIEQNTVKSLDRALTVLTTLSKNQNKTLTDLSKELRESPSTVYRILSTMALHKIVECDDRLQTWNIGPGSFQIGSSFLRRTSLVETSRPFLRNLMEETGETANLGIENNGNVLFLSQVETHAPIRAFFPPGTLSPLHASGIGKVLLTQYTLPKLEKFIKSGLEPFTQYTNSTLELIQGDMAITLERGYAIDDQERNIGMRCIAAPIKNAFGEVIAGISVSGPTSRVASDQIAEFSRSVVNTAREVSIEYIQKVVCDYFDLPIELMKSKTRKREVVQARQIAMYFSKKMTKSSLANIGMHCGGKDHATVLHACRTVNNLSETDKNFRAYLADLEKKLSIQ